MGLCAKLWQRTKLIYQITRHLLKFKLLSLASSDSDIGILILGKGLISLSDHRTNHYATFIKVEGLINHSRLYVTLCGAQNSIGTKDLSVYQSI